MCVLICRVGPEPLLGANRDEHYARPFSAPRRWVAATPFWAPRDEEQGGSWIGVNAAGLTAAITNRSRLETRPDRASRGQLVTGLLARPALAEARRWLEDELARAPRNPCQVFVAQGAEAFVCQIDGAAFSSVMLEPGVHVLSNLHDRGEIDFGLAPGAGFEQMRPILADTGPQLPRGIAVCKRGGWRGTVASALIEPHRSFLFAGGPPDEAVYEPVPGYPE